MTKSRRLLISTEIRSYITRLHRQLKQKVRAAFDALVVDPGCGKPLQGALLGVRSLRAGKFRVIYRPFDDAIQIVAIGPRHTIYEEAQRLARIERG